MTQTVQDIRRRLVEVCRQVGLDSYQQIADALGESYASIRRYVGGFEDRTPSLEFVIKVCDRFEISADWLLFGRLPQRRGEVDLGSVPDDVIHQAAHDRRVRLERDMRDLLARLGQPRAQSEEVAPSRADQSERELRPSNALSLYEPGFAIIDAEQLPGDWAGRYVPLIGRVAAGVGLDTAEAESYPAGVAAHYVRLDDPSRAAFAVQIEGDSMEPQYRHGDLVISDGRTPGSSGEVCIVLETTATGDRIARVKRLRVRGKSAVLESLNPAHAPIRCEAARVRALAILRHLPQVRRVQ